MPIIHKIDSQNNDAFFQFWTNNVNTSTFTLDPINSTIHQTVLLSPVIVPYFEHVNNITEVQGWINNCENSFKLSHVMPINFNQIYNKSDGTCTGTFKISGYNFSLSYDKISNNITVNAHNAHTYTWQEFILFMRFQTRFNNEILSSY